MFVIGCVAAYLFPGAVLVSALAYGGVWKNGDVEDRVAGSVLLGLFWPVIGFWALAVGGHKLKDWKDERAFRIKQEKKEAERLLAAEID